MNLRDNTVSGTFIDGICCAASSRVRRSDLMFILRFLIVFRFRAFLNFLAYVSHGLDLMEEIGKKVFGGDPYVLSRI
jgi:hypothetical protein